MSRSRGPGPHLGSEQAVALPPAPGPHGDGPQHFWERPSAALQKGSAAGVPPPWSPQQTPPPDCTSRRPRRLLQRCSENPSTTLSASPPPRRESSTVRQKEKFTLRKTIVSRPRMTRDRLLWRQNEEKPRANVVSPCSTRGPAARDLPILSLLFAQTMFEHSP